MKNELIINKATAIYTGGGIYCYYAELNDGNWLMGCDDWIIVVNANPLFNVEIYNESGYEEWQQEHLVEYIPDSERPLHLTRLIDVILQGNSIKEWDNFLTGDLKTRYKLLSEEMHS